MNEQNVNLIINGDFDIYKLCSNNEEMSFDMLKSTLIKLVANIINDSDWNQNYAAKILGIDQPKISQIKNLKYNGFSLEKLMRFITILNYKITISIDKSDDVICKD